MIWGVAIALMSWHPSAAGLDLAEGAGTFRDRCGACHMLDRGVSTHHGPNLASIGADAVTRKPGMTAAQYLLESILEPNAFVAPHNRAGMPKNVADDLSPTTIRNLVAFLAGQGAAAAYGEIRSMEMPQRTTNQQTRIIRLADMDLAENALRTKGNCLQCHSPYRNAEYQVAAPSLFGLGLTDPQQVRESIVKPNEVVMPAYASVLVQLTNGRTETGRLISTTEEGIVLLMQDDKGQWICRSFSSNDLESDPELVEEPRPPRSPMPTGFDQLLTDRELDAIVTLIRQLNQ
jgi:mono/diheme cytochrome c family protein